MSVSNDINNLRLDVQELARIVNGYMKDQSAISATHAQMLKEQADKSTQLFAFHNENVKNGCAKAQEAMETIKDHDRNRWKWVTVVGGVLGIWEIVRNSWPIK